MKTNESRLHEVLLHGYNKYAHPSFNTTAPVHVEFDFQLIRIIGVVSSLARVLGLDRAGCMTAREWGGEAWKVQLVASVS